MPFMNHPRRHSRFCQFSRDAAVPPALTRRQHTKVFTVMNGPLLGRAATVSPAHLDREVVPTGRIGGLVDPNLPDVTACFGGVQSALLFLKYLARHPQPLNCNFFDDSRG